MIEVTLDFETASTVNLKKSGPWPYAENPTTEILCLWYDVGGGEPRKCDHLHPGGDLLRYIGTDEAIFIAHGAGFEKAIWRKVMVPEFGWPDIPNKRWHDTQAVCAMKVIPQKLEKALLTLGLDEQKDMEGSKVTVALSKPSKKGYFDRSPEKLAIVDRYCAQDIRTETLLHKRLGYLPPGERQVWLLNQRVNERGLRLDMDFVRQAQKVVDRALVPLEAEFKQLTGGLDIGQRDRIIAWAKGQGFTLHDMTAERIKDLLGGSIDDAEDDETDPHGAGAHVVLPSAVRRVLTIRQLAGSASVKKLAAMEACVCADGRARGLLQYHGTGPGRSAGRLLQPQNFPRGTLTLGKAPPPVGMVVEAIMTGDPDYVEMLLGPPIETVVGGLRHAIVSEPGRTFVSGDYAGIQARVVLALAGQHDKTALMASGADVYCDMASKIYHRPITKADKAERQTGKNSVLGLGFQMGWRKFLLKYGKGLTEEFCQEVVRVYRKDWAPRVPYLWYGLEEAATEAVWSKRPCTRYGVEYRIEDRWLSARLPSGRKIWYFNPQPIKRRMPYDQDVIKECFTYQATKMGQMKTIDAFGGQLTENVVMGIERDIMTNAMFKLEANGFPLVLDVHDEIVGEPLKADADEKAFTEIMLDTQDWVKAMKIPIAIETWQGERYRK